MEQKQDSSLPLRTRFILSLVSISNNFAMRPDGTVDRRFRLLIDLLKSSASSKPVKGIKTHDVTIDPDRNLWFRVFVPVEIAVSGENLPVLIYFHGGGFAFFGPDSMPFDDLGRRLARMVPAVVVSVNYRLTPEHRYPSQYEDGFDVLKFLDDGGYRDHLPENADLSRCFLAGDSAGGNLAHHVGKRASETSFRQLKVIGLVLLQPFFGGEERTASETSPLNSKGLSLKETDWYWNAFKPLSTSSEEEWNRDHEVINVSGPRAVDISKMDFPATLVVVGGRDILLDWQMKYFEWLKKSGKEAYLVEYPNMFHGFYAYLEVPESSEFISAVADFVHKQGNKSSNKAC